LLRDALDAFARAGGPVDVALPGEPFDDLNALWRRNDLLLCRRPAAIRTGCSG
jgi:hypothetical protein